MTEPMADALRELYALLEDSSRWTWATMARDADGNHVPPTHPAACSWCLTGGAYKVAGDVGPAWDVMGALSAQLTLEYPPPSNDYQSRLEWFNDSCVHGEVLDLIRSAMGES